MSTQPRSATPRIMLTLLILVGSWSAGGGLALVIPVDPLIFLSILALYAFLATRVSLRWYYALWLCVPIANIYVSWKIAWRVAYLPWRDWELLPGEPAREHDLVPPPAKRHEDRVAVRRD